MSIEATAEALVTEAVPVEVPSEPQEAPEVSEADELGAIFDKNEGTDDQTPDEPQEAKIDEPEVVEEPEKTAPIDAPSEVPKGLKQHWANIPEEARSEVQSLIQETNRKLSDQGRLIQGISPIRDALVEATEQFPAMAGMAPKDVAQQAFNLAKISADFETKPVETLMGLIQKHNIGPQVAAALQGQPMQEADTGTQQTIAQLQRKIAELSDPDYIRSQVTAVTSEQTTMNDVTNFAANAEHWDAVEDHLPRYVELMRDEMGESASASDVLKSAYELAVSRLVPEDKKAPAPTANEAVNIADPEKAKAVIKAKSVNVTGKPGKQRVLTEDEELAMAFDRSQKS